MVEKLYVTYNDASPRPPPQKAHAGQNQHGARARRENEHITTKKTHVSNSYAPSHFQVHKLCQESAAHILDNFKPHLMIAIGGGGYVPARILRSFLKKTGSPNIPIQAIGLSLYETLSDTVVEEPGKKVTRTQWLDLTSLGEMKNLIGKKILIVDEVDDTRTTLEYAVKELEKDVEAARQKLGLEGEDAKTEFSIFVLHNKNKQKKGTLPAEMMDNGRYMAARTVGDEWICYPWEAEDIEEHDELSRQMKAKQANGSS